jgi:predicted SAM-dependent methyltransferase
MYASNIKNKLYKYVPSFIIHSIRFIRYTKSKIYIKNLLNKQKDIYLEIGSGAKKGKNSWITLDCIVNADIYWNLQRGIPFPNDSVRKIYSSHLFEHLSFKDMQKLLDECLRVLTPGGVFSICVPNSKLYIEAYLKNEKLDSSIFFGHKPAFDNVSRLDYINYIAYMDGEHKYMFDEENLTKIIENNGFKDVSLRDFDDALDKQDRDFESIYAEAKK